MHRLPGHRMWCIFPGTRRALNFGGMSVALWGIWKSPMHKTKTMADKATCWLNWRVLDAEVLYSPHTQYGQTRLLGEVLKRLDRS